VTTDHYGGIEKRIEVMVEAGELFEAKKRGKGRLEREKPSDGACEIPRVSMSALCDSYDHLQIVRCWFEVERLIETLSLANITTILITRLLSTLF